MTEALTSVRQWLADERLDGTPLVVLTRGAVPVPGAVSDPGGAAVWGLVRSAQTEHPDRFVLVDVDAEPTDDRTRAALATAIGSGEPQLAIRDGALTVPRLAKAGALSEVDGVLFDPDGTVLITGGTGALSAALARHLITEHGARNLVLTSRRGPDAPGAPQLRERLTELGARVEIAACDAADRDALAALLAAIPDEHPLTGVIHAAGVVDDATVETITDDQVAAVLRPKVDAAANLDELVGDVAMFVLFSSATSVLGTAGQGSYAAANAYLDALATSRHAAGRRATALSWGLWAPDSGADGAGSTMTSHLSEADLARINRGGVHAHTVEEGLALFDAACRAGEPHLVPVKLDHAALRTATGLAAPLRAFTRNTARRAERGGDAGAALAEQLAGRGPAEQRELLLNLVRGTVATVLAHSSSQTIRADEAFKQLGFDSLTAVELRNRLNAATGLRLGATLVFDYPTPAALVDHLVTELGGSQSRARVRALQDGIASLGSALELVEHGDADPADIAAALQGLLVKWREKTVAPDAPATAEAQDDLAEATADDLFDILDSELDDVA